MKIVAVSCKRRCDIGQSSCDARCGGWTLPRKKTKMRFSVNCSSYRKPQSACRLLSYLSLYDSNLTTIVATRWANSVVKVESTAVAALSERRSYSSIMGATLEGTSLRLSSFRMCHCCIVFCIIILGMLRTIYKMIAPTLPIPENGEPQK